MLEAITASLQDERLQSDSPALIGSSSTLSYGQLVSLVQYCAESLNGERFGIFMDNDPAWIIVDLAILEKKKTCIPLPTFFSDSQLEHVINDAGIDCIITDQPDRIGRITGVVETQLIQLDKTPLWLIQVPVSTDVDLPENTAKVTYTSGTTGTPKGVCLSFNTMQKVADSLVTATQANEQDVTLSLLPLSTLLENIGGAYAPLLVGARSCLPSSAETGLSGSSSVDWQQMILCLHHYQPTTVILTPELLRGLLAVADSGIRLPDSLRFVAVGGAPVAPELVARARRHGLPVFVGYGLSEAGSVVALNRPGVERDGSVGKPLSHCEVKISDDGEILISGARFNGYLNIETHSNPKWYATGDVGHLDTDGYLFVTGRRRNVFITANGRNICPEWVEQELLNLDIIRYAVALGEGRPFVTAVIVPAPGASPELLDQALESANSRLPDYAQVRKSVVSKESFTRVNNRLTPGGQPNRARIQQDFGAEINAIYEKVAL